MIEVVFIVLLLAVSIYRGIEARKYRDFAKTFSFGLILVFIISLISSIQSIFSNFNEDINIENPLFLLLFDGGKYALIGYLLALTIVGYIVAYFVIVGVIWLINLIIEKIIGE